LTFRTVMTLLRGGKLRVLGSLSKVARDYHRVAFLAGALTSGLLHRLAVGPITLDALAADLRIDPARCDGLKAWLQAGVALGELGLQPEGYVAQGTLSRMLTDPNNDAAAAFVEELACLHNTLLTQAPERLRTGHPFTLADQNARMVARSSRLVEPFVCEALAGVVPKHGPVKLLEIGCGAAAYIRSAARCNPELTAVGVELQADAAALAMANIVRWSLGNRVSIEVCDIRDRNPEASFDLATLHQNIYYFPVPERTGVLGHVRSFLKRGGRLLLTTLCQGRGSTAAVLDLWGAMTTGCGRLPAPTELVAQLEAAGFSGVTARRLIPRASFYAFVGTNLGSHEG
jgi:hypothetical protein